MPTEIEDAERHRAKLEQTLRTLIGSVDEVPIGKPGQFPFGWRKAAKGRTVWRILEELISQNLQAKAKDFGLHDFVAADSEVGAYDFSFRFSDSKEIYVNIKSAVKGRAESKDDISKADKLIKFFESTAELTLFVTTIELEFLEDPLRIKLVNCYVVPVAWLPDIYVNPSNNANLQSSKYKDLSAAIRRNRFDFLVLLKAEFAEAQRKQAEKKLKQQK